MAHSRRKGDEVQPYRQFCEAIRQVIGELAPPGMSEMSKGSRVREGDPQGSNLTG